MKPMKVSDYIVEFFVSKDIDTIFGYPGGMVTHLMDSIHKNDKINNYLCYHEQGAAFAACGYAATSGKCGVVYGTSGPGAVNLLGGVANAYFDSVPLIAITGQVNTSEQKGSLLVRQKGFQEMEVFDMVKDITKYAISIKEACQIPIELEKAYSIATTGRCGAVLLDIPMNIQSTEIDILEDEQVKEQLDNDSGKLYTSEVIQYLKESKRPLFLVGNGVHLSNSLAQFEQLAQYASAFGIPIVTSMIAVDLNSYTKPNFGFIGVYGNRVANIITSQCDLLITLGSRLDCRQTGADLSEFAPKAKLIRVDIDSAELTNRIKNEELQICADLKDFLIALLLEFTQLSLSFNEWMEKCIKIISELRGFDFTEGNLAVLKLSELIPAESIITTDVGQNQVWVAQSFHVQTKQRILFSGGYGSMGYSLPCAIGAAITDTSKNIYCFAGDGGFQMNIQELHMVYRLGLPIKIFIFNNQSLGMIRHFQEMYFDSKYSFTVRNEGYSSPCFTNIGQAYNIDSMLIDDIDNLPPQFYELLNSNKPALFEICISDRTYVYPKLEFGQPAYNQSPNLPEDIYKTIMQIFSE